MSLVVNAYIVSQLVAHMWACKRRGISFARCMEDARIQFNKEVAKAADETDLDKVGTGGN